MRKIKQISAMCEEGYEHVIALCEDGTLWSGFYEGIPTKWKWNPLPCIPNDDDTKDNN